MDTVLDTLWAPNLVTVINRVRSTRIVPKTVVSAIANRMSSDDNVTVVCLIPTASKAAMRVVKTVIATQVVPQMIL